ncbi:hypothetical protein L226DRAFT_322212 [Lentinus tigrinus ALCF2SS1-7]|uniref:uncharacterized protein n=1 Tax=Lentinus tigrinus ALCF2SS1-7 TaxID=1328758 RepID=UPI001165F9EF|nr:hypothetical protein L226DRAFT_322212 [Lentinus tigrinus ALCF2SS1-7]
MPFKLKLGVAPKCRPQPRCSRCDWLHHSWWLPILALLPSTSSPCYALLSFIIHTATTGGEWFPHSISTSTSTSTSRSDVTSVWPSDKDICSLAQLLICSYAFARSIFNPPCPSLFVSILIRIHILVRVRFASCVLPLPPRVALRPRLRPPLPPRLFLCSVVSQSYYPTLAHRFSCCVLCFAFCSLPHSLARVFFSFSLPLMYRNPIVPVRIKTISFLNFSVVGCTPQVTARNSLARGRWWKTESHSRIHHGRQVRR